LNTSTIPANRGTLLDQAYELAQTLERRLQHAIRGREAVIDLLLTALLADGHVLLEDYPGSGKTTLAKALGDSIEDDQPHDEIVAFRRIQFTPDLLPSDITGVTVFDPDTGSFSFRPGPLFAHIVLADEINRTSPKTQSSLLEVMEEGQVTVDGTTYRMPKPFIVLATQNPVDFVGTYPLPEAQLDRFFMRVAIGYPTQEEEIDILDRFSTNARPMEELRAICTSQDILSLQRAVGTVYASREVRAYVAMIAAASRKHSGMQLGISTRAAISLIRASQARAMLAGRDYVIPEDIQAMAQPVLAHRIVLSPEARMRSITPERALNAVVGSVQVPVKIK